MPLRLVFCLMTALFLGAAPVIATESNSEGNSENDSNSDTGFAAAEALYDAGKYQEAMTEARALDTADGYALAARTGLVVIRYFLSAPERPAAITTALADARRALAIEPNHLEANLQAAIAIGYRGKLKRSMGDAWAGKRYIDNAIAHHPESIWALGALGGWNGEVVMEAGRFFAGALFGAKRKKAVRYFRAALKLEPGNIGIRTSFTITLLRFNRKRFEAEAILLLEETVSLAGQNALDEILLQQSRQLLQALQEGRRDDLKVLLEHATSITAR